MIQDETSTERVVRTPSSALNIGARLTVTAAARPDAIAVHAPAARMSLEAALGHEAALRAAATSVARTLD